MRLVLSRSRDSSRDVSVAIPVSGLWRTDQPNDHCLRRMLQTRICPHAPNPELGHLRLHDFNLGVFRDQSISAPHRPHLVDRGNRTHSCRGIFDAVLRNAAQLDRVTTVCATGSASFIHLAQRRSHLAYFGRQVLGSNRVRNRLRDDAVDLRHRAGIKIPAIHACNRIQLIRSLRAPQAQQTLPAGPAPIAPQAQPRSCRKRVRANSPSRSTAVMYWLNRGS